MKLIGKRYKHEKKTIKNTLGNALEGIEYCFNSEINFKFHTIAAVAVLLGSYILELSLLEVVICLILIGLVLAFELMNTVIEIVIDMVEPRENPLAKIAKDAASGAVLVTAITAAIVGLIIFVPKVLLFIGVV